MVTAVIAFITVTVTTVTAWYLGPLRRRRLLWKVDAFRIIPQADTSKHKKSVDNVRITINGKEVNEPYLYRVYIGNIGPKDLTSADYDAGAPTVIYPNATIVAELDKSHGFRISHTDEEVQFGPDLLAVGSHAMISVICDGRGETSGLGSTAMHSKWIHARDPAPRFSRAALFIGTMLLAMGVLLLSIATYFFIDDSKGLQGQLDRSQVAIESWTKSIDTNSSDESRIRARIELEYAMQWHSDVQGKIAHNKFLNPVRVFFLGMIAVAVPITIYGFGVWLRRRKVDAFAALS